jgi:hypothetical protein
MEMERRVCFYRDVDGVASFSTVSGVDSLREHNQIH